MKQRFITGALLFATATTAIWLLPTPAFAVLAAVVIAIATWEWMPLAGFPQRYQCALAAMAMLAVLVLMSINPGWRVLTSWILLASAVWWTVALLLVVTWPRSQSLWAPRWVRLAAGCAILLPCWVALVTLHESTDGRVLVLFLIALVALVDTGGYLIGRNCRRPRRLAPAVSPNKTWNGLLGGLLAATVAPIALLMQCGDRIQCTPVAVAGASAAAITAAVIGDLLESVAKRHADVKDSGQLLPGHGGLLDRIDGLVAATPLFTLVWLWTH